MQNFTLKLLHSIHPKQFVNTLENQNINILAVILSHMSPKYLSEALMYFQPDIRMKLVMLISTMKMPNEEIVKKVEKYLITTFQNSSSTNDYPLDIRALKGIQLMARTLNQIGPMAQEILRNINAIDSNLAYKIKDYMFIFEDILTLRKEYLPILFSRVEIKTLAVALRQEEQETLDKFKSVMSPRGQDKFELTFDSLTKVKIKDIESAQKTILHVAQMLIEEGQIERSFEN